MSRCYRSSLIGLLVGEGGVWIGVLDGESSAASRGLLRWVHTAAEFEARYNGLVCEAVVKEMRFGGEDLV